MSPSQPTQPQWPPFWVPSSNSTAGLSLFRNILSLMVTFSIWTAFDRPLRHSCLVGIKSTWSASELPHNPIVYRWGCSICACTSTLFDVLFLAIYSSFVKWTAGSYFSRSRNNNRSLLPIPAWSCHNNKCRVLPASFNCVCSFSGFLLVLTSLEKKNLSLSSQGLGLGLGLFVTYLFRCLFIHGLFWECRMMN